MDDLRKEIDQLDKDLLEVLAKRFDVVRKIGEIKKTEGKVPFDQQRWEEVLKQVTEKAITLGLSKEFVKKLFDVIHEEAIEIESSV